MAKSTSTVNDNEVGGARPSLRERAAGVDPVLLAAGAAMVGAIAGASVPRSAGETRLLAPVGKHMNDAVKSFGMVARQALSAEIAGVPVVGQIAAEQLDRVIESVVPSTAVESEPDAEDHDPEKLAQTALAD